MITDRDDALWGAAEQWWEDEVEKRVAWLEAVGLVLVLDRLRKDKAREEERARIVVECAVKGLERATRERARVDALTGTCAQLAAQEAESWE